MTGTTDEADFVPTTVRVEMPYGLDPSAVVARLAERWEHVKVLVENWGTTNQCWVILAHH